MGCVIGKIHYGLKVVFCLRHFYLLLTSLCKTTHRHWAHINVCRASCGGVSVFITVYGVICVQLAHFSIVNWEDISIAHVIIIIKSEVSTFPIVIIYFRGRMPEMFVTSYSVTYCIYVPGNQEFVFIIIVQFMSANSQIRFGLQIVLVCL